MHKHFEELCALAATGQIAGESMAILDEHVKECDKCRVFLQDIVPLKAHVAPVVAASHALIYEPPEGIRERFLQRASRAGLALNPGPAIDQAVEVTATTPLHPIRSDLQSLFRWAPFPFRLAIPAAAAVLCGVLGYWIALQKMSLTPSRVTAVAPSVSMGSDLSSQKSKEEIARLQTANEEGRTRVAALDAELVRAEQEKKDLLRQLSLVAQSAARGAQLEQQIKMVTSQLQASEERIGKLTTDLSAERGRAATADAVLAAQQKASEDANSRAAGLQAQLERLRDVGADGSQAGELIAARNLHIVDVYDSGSSGDRQKAFGRIFYVEGKALVFYAYDLPAKVKDRKIEFKVWGEQAGLKSVSLSLGAMQNDSSGQGRWLLTCNDQKVLSKINAIYITRENGDHRSTQPQGQKMMYAFLGSANHP